MASRTPLVVGGAMFVGKIAILFGIVFDRTMRMLEPVAAFVEDRGEVGS